MLPIVKGHNKHAKTVKSRAPFVYEGRCINYGGRSTELQSLSSSGFLCCHWAWPVAATVFIFGLASAIHRL